MSEEIKMKKIQVQGRDTGEFVQNILDKIKEGYEFDQYQTHKVGYVHYTTMTLKEDTSAPVEEKKSQRKPRQAKQSEE